MELRIHSDIMTQMYLYTNSRKRAVLSFVNVHYFLYSVASQLPGYLS